jgi:thiamine biosynthesis protein ThiI
VDLEDAELTVAVDIVPERAFVSLEKHQGAGGLPVSTSGRVLALLSGGIDSPVAVWRMMRRGCRVDFVHFHSMPFHDRTSQDKARELARLLVRWQLDGVLYLVPFGEVQRQIVAAVRRPLRVVLYRRMMLRIAEEIAPPAAGGGPGHRREPRTGGLADARNLAVIEAATELPVLRPLIGMDKGEISDAAAVIGTLETSIVPDQDCCQLFVPRHPTTHAAPAAVHRAERALDVPALVAPRRGRHRERPPALSGDRGLRGGDRPRRQLLIASSR